MRALFLTVTLAAMLAGADRPDRLAAKNVFDLASVSDPRISPDGKRIVYVRHFADMMTDDRYTNLWTINFDGTGNRPLTSGNFNDSSPQWSPSGDRILYVSNRGGHEQIWVRWMDSGQTARVTDVGEEPGEQAGLRMARRSRLRCWFRRSRDRSATSPRRLRAQNGRSPGRSSISWCIASTVLDI